MYCFRCGNKINSSDIYCSHCGIKIENEEDNVIVSNEFDKVNGAKNISLVFGIIAIIASFLVIFSPFGLILSIIGLIYGLKVRKRTGNVLGVILNSLALFISLILSILIVLGFYFSIHMIDGLWHEDTHYEEKYYDYRNKF